MSYPQIQLLIADNTTHSLVVMKTVYATELIPAVVRLMFIPYSQKVLQSKIFVFFVDLSLPVKILIRENNRSILHH